MRIKLFLTCCSIIVASLLAVTMLTQKAGVEADDSTRGITGSSDRQMVASLITDASNAINDKDKDAYLRLYGEVPGQEARQAVEAYFDDLPKDYSVTITVKEVTFSNDMYSAVVKTNYESKADATAVVTSSEKSINVVKAGAKWILILPPQADLPSDGVTSVAPSSEDAGSAGP